MTLEAGKVNVFTSSQNINSAVMSNDFAFICYPPWFKQTLSLCSIMRLFVNKCQTTECVSLCRQHLPVREYVKAVYT